MPVPSLPDDVFLAFVSCTDIDTFFTLRQLSRGTQALINTHLIGVSKAVARATFPHQKRIFLQVPAPRTADRCLHWLRELRSAQVAAILLEHARQVGRGTEGPYQPVASEDPLGDDLRTLLTRGCKVSQKMSAIVHQDPGLRHQVVSLGEDDEVAFAKHKALRFVIFAKQMDYIDGLLFDDIRGYKLLSALLRTALSFRTTSLLCDFHVPPLKSLLNAALGIEERRWIRIHSDYLLMNVGPRLLWAAWWAPWSLNAIERSVPRHVLRMGQSISVWTTPQEHSIIICRQQIEDMRVTVNRKMLRTAPNDSIPGSHLPRAEKLRIFHPPETVAVFEERERRTLGGEHPPPFIFGNITALSMPQIERREAVGVDGISRHSDADLERRVLDSLIPSELGIAKHRWMSEDDPKLFP
ncbi:hypothetical protein LTR97_012732 [Elasticomyces elasticus]|uniref:Uncharacterized protein n=1 Tax=Elasticomyces elasticus TaxID=574655 RepID=A0AAN7ZKI9_9PEZI|nr:hypothetical protein LTR97_012732 [Elasticomyces elasticus]